MAEAVQKSIIQEGIEIGEAQGELRGELKGSIRNILAILRDKFQYVPDDIIGELYKRTNVTALESLGILSAQCNSLDEFAEGLK